MRLDARNLGHVVVIGLCLLVHPLSAAAVTYYANPTNTANCPCTAPNLNTNGACGVQANPYSCVADGANKAATGDTVIAVSGTYNECVFIQNKQGITVKSQVSHGAVIQRNHLHPACAQGDPDTGRQSAVTITNSSGVLFQGFKVTGASASGVFVYGTGSDNEVDDIEAYGNGTGLLFYAGDNTIRNSNAHDNQGDGIALAGAPDMRLFSVTSTSNSGSGLSLHVGSDRTNVATLTSSDNSGFGVYLASNDNSLATVTINDNGSDGLYVPGSDNAVSDGQILRNSRGIIVACFNWPCTTTPVNNQFYTLDVGYSRTYDGIRIDGGTGTIIENSRIHHGPSNGIIENRNASQSTIQYNEIDNNGAKGTPWLGHGLYLGGVSSTIRGNKVHENGGYGVHLWAAPWGTPQSHYIVEHNDVYRNGAGMVLGGSNVSPADPNELPQYTEIRYNVIHHNNDMGFWYQLTTCAGLNNTGNSFHHNTVVDNDGVSQIWITHAYDDQFIFKNNIVLTLPDRMLVAAVKSNMRLDGSDGNLYYRPGSGSNPLFEWNGSDFNSLAALQSPGVPQANPSECQVLGSNPIPMDVHSTYSGGISLIDPTMKRWQDDPFGAPYNGNFHLMPGSSGIAGGVCCTETTAGSDIDGESSFCSPADCVSAGTGVGADHFLDTDVDGMPDRYDCLPTQAWNAMACDGDAYDQSQEGSCGLSGPFDRYAYPGAPEICDGKDNDCNGLTLPGGETDADRDGFFFDDMACAPALLDCDDADPTIHPDMQELCDGKDNDCNDLVDELGTFTCGVGICQRTVDVCADEELQTCTPGSPSGEATTWPGTCLDGLDNDCDGRTDNDCGTDVYASGGQLVVTGSIASGAMSDLSAGSYDDYYEKIDEALVGSSYRLTAVWTFVNPVGGLLHDLVVEGYRAFGNDSFQFSKATRATPPCTASESWSAAILSIYNPTDTDQVRTASTDVTGPVTCIRVIDSVTSGDSTKDRLALDRLYLFPTPVATGENGPSPGTLTFGTYATTHKSDDANETFVENTTGNPNDLVHTWTFQNVPAGSSHQLNWEGHRSSAGGDNFKFYYSTDNQNFTVITGAEIKKTFQVQGGEYSTFGGSGLSGTIYIRMKDNSASNSTATTVYVDRLAIKTIP